MNVAPSVAKTALERIVSMSTRADSAPAWVADWFGQCLIELLVRVAEMPERTATYRRIKEMELLKRLEALELDLDHQLERED